MSDQSVCKEFSLHPVKNICNNCERPREQHAASEEDAERVKRLLNIFSDQPKATPDEQYAWTPPQCPEGRLDEYFSKFSSEMVPRHGTVGQQRRLGKLIFQVPLTDVSQDSCRFIEPDSMSDQESFIRRLQDNILRIGIVKEMSQGMAVQCPRCFLIIEMGELVVVSGDESGPAYHPECFVCFQCGDALADLIHCADIDGTIYCVRHYCDTQMKRCHVCDELIFSPRYALANEKFYHKQHLVCYNCGNELTNRGYDRQDELYCGACFEELFAKNCAKCRQRIPIEGRYISYKGDNWHSDCFTCGKCEALLSENRFEIKDEAFYCTDCYNKHFAPRCEGCQEVFDTETKVLDYEGKIYHVSCFKCFDCADVIGTGSFVPHKGRVYCKNCHLRNFGVRCFRCRSAITDNRSILHNKQPYHEDCFTCYKCSTKISGKPFKTVSENWYCMDCYRSTFCPKCHACEESILPGSDHDVLFSYEDFRWHASCFVCSVCKTYLAETPFLMHEKALVCKACLQKYRKESAGSSSIEIAVEKEDQTEKADGKKDQAEKAAEKKDQAEKDSS